MNLRDIDLYPKWRSFDAQISSVLTEWQVWEAALQHTTELKRRLWADLDCAREPSEEVDGRSAATLGHGHASSGEWVCAP